jgi:hypothetical protein
METAMSDKKRDYANGRCCVFQPFDNGGDFDKRFDDVLSPAIEAADLEPYRVDRDMGAVIPVETLHKEIKSATVCVADITTRNPNVMYELGYAIAAGKDIVIISGPNTEKYPFDIQHRGIIPYSIGSMRDFQDLGKKITAKLSATLELQEKTTEIVEASPVKDSAGLRPHEQTVLALILANSDATDDSISATSLKQEMRKAGYSDLGTRVATAGLVRLGYIQSGWHREDYEGWVVYSLTPDGEEWLVENQFKLQLRTLRTHPSVADHHTEIKDEDIPF